MVGIGIIEDDRDHVQDLVLLLLKKNDGDLGVEIGIGNVIKDDTGREGVVLEIEIGIEEIVLKGIEIAIENGNYEYMHNFLVL